jgi:hypothetical protein
MHQPNRFIKAAVLASSIMLVAALVAYRANAFPWQSGLEPVTADSGSHVTSAADSLPVSREPLPLPNDDINPFDTPRTPFDEVVAARATATVSASGSDGALMSSPKFGPVFVRPEFTVSGSGSDIFYSSKDGIVLPPYAFTASPSDGTVMGSSKSDRVIVPQKTAQAKARPATVMPGSKSAAVIPAAPTPPVAPAKTGWDATMMSSSKSIVLTPPPKQAAANAPARGKSQSAQRARQSQVQEPRP